jgi:hypothetical protein
MIDLDRYQGLIGAIACARSGEGFPDVRIAREH